ncbi:MAG: hypothetical protein JO353_13380 [Phycisphaerae bacterium]|nr:hypothetical protein [Phycisphaerae bacterium]
MPPIDPDSLELPQYPALNLPNFREPGWAMTVEDFDARTKRRLLDDLTNGDVMVAGRMPMRDPSDPQPPTATHALYVDEANALEKIWHDDFFAGEGLTVLYRESPAALDEEMPLHIYTDMYHYIQLSRCGLVLNQGIQLSDIDRVNWDFIEFENAKTDEARKPIIADLRAHRLMAAGLARIQMRTNPRLPAMLELLMKDE